MKRLLGTLFVLLGTLFFIQAQNVVSNTNWEMDDTGERVIVTYDLNRQGENSFFDIELFGVLDGIEFKARAVSGDVGTFIKAGRSNKIVWEIFRDVSEADGSLAVKVVATKSGPGGDTGIENSVVKTKVNNPVPVYAGLGGVVTIGGGLFIAGVSKFSNAKSEYDDDIRPKYDGLVGPTDPSYRQEYDDVNKRYKNGQVLMAGGGAVILVGGFILVKRLIDIKKIQGGGTSYLDVQPQLELGTPGSENGHTVGLSIRYRF